MSVDERSKEDAGPAIDAETRRLAARRRFLRGAGSSAALVMTVTHRRAFAGVKKNVIASACVSIQGVPDLKGIDAKKGLQTSAMGTPKGAICRPRAEDNSLTKKNKTYEVGDCGVSNMDTARYFDQNGNPVQFVRSNALRHGCGSSLPNAMPPNSTISASYNYRLYEKGYCPIVWQGDTLTYDSSKQYFDYVKGVNHGPDVLTGFNCKMP